MNQMNDDMPEIAAAYARKSTLLSNQEKSLPEQIKGMKEAADKMGIPLPDDLIFTDAASGTSEKNRYGLEALKKAARDGTLKKRGVSHVFYWSTDRIGRNVADSLLFEAEMARAGIKCYSVTEKYDVSTMGGKTEFTLRSLLAEAQNKRRAADTRRGMRSTILAGKFIAQAPYGFTKNATKDLCINVPRAAIVRRMFSLLLAGKSPRQITRALNHAKVPSPTGKVWQHVHVSRLLRSEFYAGIVVYGLCKWLGPKGYKRDAAIVEPYHHPAIIDWDTFIRAQKVLDTRSRLRRCTTTVKYFYLLSAMKLLRCGVCGRVLLGKRCISRGIDYFYYQCLSQGHYGVKCGLPSIPCEILDRVVLDQLAAYAGDRAKIELAWARHHEEIAPQVTPAREEIAAIDKQLAALGQRKARLGAAFAEAEVALPVLKAEVKKLTDAEQHLENRRRELQVQIEKISKTMADGGVLEKLANFRQTFDRLPPEGKKMLIRTFVESITIKAKDQFEIALRFLPQRLEVTAAQPAAQISEEVQR